MKNLLLILALFIGNVFSETLEIYCKDFPSTNIIFDSDSMTVYSQHFDNLEYKIKINLFILKEYSRVARND